MAELIVKGSPVRIDMSQILVNDFRKLGKSDEEIYYGFLNFVNGNTNYVNGR